MPHLLSSKLDTTLRYNGGLYGLATAVLTQISGAVADAANALATAAAASTAASSATTTANAASTAASSATTTANNAVATANSVGTSLTSHIGSGGTSHAQATSSVNGFMSSTHFTKVDSLVAGQPSTLGRITVDAVLETPDGFAYAASRALDVGLKNDHCCSAALSGNITFTFTNGAAGRQGLIAVRQDATGGRTVTFTPPGGWTLYRDAGTTNLQAAAGANAITMYTYAFVTVGGANMLFIGKLTPVAA